MPKCANKVNSTPLAGLGLLGPESVEVAATPEQATGNADATWAIQSAIAGALSTGIGRVTIPRGVYKILKTIKVALEGPQRLELFASQAVLLAGSQDASPVLDISGGVLSVRGLTIDCNHVSACGFHALKLTNRISTVEDVSVVRSSTNGFELEACQGAVFRECVARCNAGDGWSIRGANACHFASCSASHNIGSGFAVSGLALPKDGSSQVFPAGCYITRVLSEHNGLHGINLAQPYNLLRRQDGYVVVRDGVVRENRGHGVLVGLRNTVVSGLWITAPQGDAFAWSRGIAIDPSTRNVLALGNYVSAPVGPPAYKTIPNLAGDKSVVIDWSYGFE